MTLVVILAFLWLLSPILARNTKRDVCIRHQVSCTGVLLVVVCLGYTLRVANLWSRRLRRNKVSARYRGNCRCGLLGHLSILRCLLSGLLGSHSMHILLLLELLKVSLGVPVASMTSVILLLLVVLYHGGLLIHYLPLMVCFLDLALAVLLAVVETLIVASYILMLVVLLRLLLII